VLVLRPLTVTVQVQVPIPLPQTKPLSPDVSSKPHRTHTSTGRRYPQHIPSVDASHLATSKYCTHRVSSKLSTIRTCTERGAKHAVQQTFRVSSNRLRVKLVIVILACVLVPPTDKSFLLEDRTCYGGPEARTYSRGYMSTDGYR
jgi:hypothetical protein